MYFWFNVKEFQLPKCIENNHDLSFVNFLSFLEFYFLRRVWSIDLNYLFLIYNLFYFSQFIKFWLCFSRVLTVLIVISEFALKTQRHDIWLWITAQKTYFSLKISSFFVQWLVRIIFAIRTVFKFLDYLELKNPFPWFCRWF